MMVRLRRCPHGRVLRYGDPAPSLGARDRPRPESRRETASGLAGLLPHAWPPRRLDLPLLRDQPADVLSLAAPVRSPQSHDAGAALPSTASGPPAHLEPHLGAGGAAPAAELPPLGQGQTRDPAAPRGGDRLDLDGRAHPHTAQAHGAAAGAPAPPGRDAPALAGPALRHPQAEGLRRAGPRRSAPGRYVGPAPTAGAALDALHGARRRLALGRRGGPHAALGRPGDPLPRHLPSPDALPHPGAAGRWGQRVQGGLRGRLPATGAAPLRAAPAVAEAQRARRAGPTHAP